MGVRQFNLLLSTTVGVVALLACSPALNWRSVALHRMHTVLPCKPDSAQRPVALGAQNVTLQMLGCEADGALFAISHITLPDAAQAGAALDDWRQSALHNLRAAPAASSPVPSPAQGTSRASGAALPALQQLRLAPTLAMEVQGQQADGRAVQARLLWWVVGADVYHWAIYAPTLRAELIDPMVLAWALH